MKEDMIRRAIGGIDDDLIECAEKAPERGRAARPWARRAAVAAVIAVAAIAAVAVLAAAGVFDGSAPAENGGGDAIEASESGADAIVVPGVLKNDDTAAPDTLAESDGGAGEPGVLRNDPATVDSGDGGEPSAGDGSTAYFFIPALPPTNEIDFVGEVLTDDEAKEYFAENLASIASSLSASGVAADALTVSERGYVHIKYYGLEGEKLTVDRAWRDYLAYNGDTLCAIITLSKENGKIYSSPAFGSPRFAEIDSFLKAHAGEELIWIYAGPGEITLAPDGSALMPVGSQLSWYFGGLEDPYSWFYDKNVLFVPESAQTDEPVRVIEGDAPAAADPGAVHTSESVSYDEAKARFGHPIAECTRGDFVGYRVGIVSRQGNVDSEEAFCLDVTYEFTDGHVYLQDQDRFVGSLAGYGVGQFEYRGRTFIDERYGDGGQIEIGYYPTDDVGIAYRAIFDASADLYEIMDLIISLEIAE